MKSMLRKMAPVLVAAFVIAAFGVSAAQAVDWPSRPLELIVPFKPGGDTDFHARTYAKYLEKELGQTVTIINVDGAGGNVGCQQVMRARPDGYKLLFYHTGNLFTNKLLDDSTPVDQNSFDFACLAVLDDTNILLTHKDSNIKTGEDLLAIAKNNPGSLSVATTISGFSYFVVCKVEAAAGIELNAVDYGGAAAMIPAILGNQVNLAANSYGVFRQYILNGDLIPLFVCSKQRNPSFPDVPTAAELGMKDADAARAYFFAFPKGTDPEYLKKLSAAVEKVSKNPEYAKDIKNAYSLEPFFVGYDGTKAYMDDMWKDMVKYKDMLQK